MLSHITVHDVTRSFTDDAVRLLREDGLRGHTYAIDAVLAAIARRVPGPVSVLTSDPEDLTPLCGPAVTIIKI
ncbi:hypothetical protein ACFPM3_29395 [Streptomyces coeruleoprunus]|uniref:DNA-binding protein n=1 Tax=Streptomyces coeruleoprunus TaxID=285563 RepID=A0ABV9XLI5_9ACTN